VPQAERVRDGWQHITGVSHGGQRHEYHPVAVAGPLGDRERQPGLADATGPGQRDDPFGGE
jgi:hypothetical protein